MADKKKQIVRAKAKPPPEPPVMVIRRNAAPRPAIARKARSERKAMAKRMQSMDASHVAVGVGAGAVGSIAGVVVVGQGWLSPKATAGVITGTGVATTTAGYLMESDHVMVAGAGLTAAGVFSLANQYAIEAYEGMEKRAEDKKEEAKAKELAEGKQGQTSSQNSQNGQADKPKQAAHLRNGRRLIVIDGDGNPVDYAS